MNLRKIIVHELKKEPGIANTELITSNTLLPINQESIELVEALLSSYQGDKILYAEFDNNPGRFFPNRFFRYTETGRTDQEFVDFTLDAIGNLETIIRNKILSKGGYLVTTEYSVNGNDFVAIFLIRDTEGKLLQRTQNSFSIQRVEYLDTNHLAMACRINETKLNENEQNYLSFTRHRQQEVSDYFTDWISVSQLESSTEYTNSLYEIINRLPTPMNPETNIPYSIDEVRNMVFENARSNAQRNVNLQVLSQQIYGNSNTILDYAEENQISIDTEFRYNKRALRRFVQVSVNKDGVNLKFSRGDVGTKIRPSEDDPNIVIIESPEFANALRDEI